VGNAFPGLSVIGKPTDAIPTVFEVHLEYHDGKKPNRILHSKAKKKLVSTSNYIREKDIPIFGKLLKQVLSE